MNQKKKFTMLLCTGLALILILAIIFNRNKSDKMNMIKLAESENGTGDIISTDVNNMTKTGTSFSCTIILKSNNPNNKIKSVRTPNDKFLQISDGDGVEKFAIDFKGELANYSDYIFYVERMDNDIEEETLQAHITYYDYNGNVFLQIPVIKGDTQSYAITNTSPEPSSGKHFIGWSYKKDTTEEEYQNTSIIRSVSAKNGDVNLYGVFIDAANNYTDNLGNDSLLGKVSTINTGGVQNITVKDDTYSARVLYFNKDLVLDGVKEIEGASLYSSSLTYELGTEEDVGSYGNYAKNMVILKVNGNITINNGVTVTAYKSSEGYGGPKGLLIYATGEVYNNGTINMTARGAYAVGQNVWLWNNGNNGTPYEYVPATGASGGSGRTPDEANWPGYDGSDGYSRRTGGGGARMGS